MKKQKNKKLSQLDDVINDLKKTKKNILLIMADEFRYPINDTGGMLDEYKKVLGFQEGHISDEAKKLFPGFVKLRENAVVLKNHTVATTACVPSRSVMFTGQYGTKNKVTQTDGVFKGASEEGFYWLDPEGIPTMGDWFKAYGYSTHYFGKCHFAHPKKQSLKRWGFDDWETSFPEPHGTLKNNLGMYRDHGFTDLVTTFLRRKGMALDYDQEVGKIEMDEDLNERQKEKAIKRIKKKPWFAVASFTNPHDITTWPLLPAKAQFGDNDGSSDNSTKDSLQKNSLGNLPPLGIPPKGTLSSPPEGGTWKFDMNPGGIGYDEKNKPKDCATLPSSWDENLMDKPDCQFDYSIKLGIALAAKTGSQIKANNAPLITGIPLTLAKDPEEWTKAYIQYYTYLHHVLDQQIERVLKTLDETGLRNDTIVVFVPDHGEYGGSHGQMMQKWHSAYQEAIHVPVVFSLPPEEENDDNKNTCNNTLSTVEELTSHIDITPTLLGLAGVTSDELKELKKELGGKKVPKFVGADLSDVITGEANTITDPLNPQKDRNAILFTTSDMITEPISRTGSTLSKPEDYNIYLNAVDSYIKRPPNYFNEDQKQAITRLKPGPVVQPAELHCVREDEWKLVRYRDYYDPFNETKFQWELYNLEYDSIEVHNLLKYNTNIEIENRFVVNQKALDQIPELQNTNIIETAEYLYDKMCSLIDQML